MSNADTLQAVIVDDSEVSRKYVREILEKTNCTFAGQAQNIKQGLAFINTADLYIIDIVMPYLSGLELLKSLEQNEYTGHIIVTSSLNNESIILEALSKGAIDFIKKPFVPQDLIDAISKIQKE